MKRFLQLLLYSLISLMIWSTNLHAQQITITLSPGWNWISYPNAMTMQLDEAFGEFIPMEGDILKIQNAFTTYQNDQWNGNVTHLIPGMGILYLSTRSEQTSFSFATNAYTTVNTITPTDITYLSATVGGTVVLNEGSHVFLRGICWGTEPNPDIDGSHTIEGTGAGDFSSVIEDLEPCSLYYIRAYAVTDYGLTYGNEVSFNTGCDYADLGLPSGLLWATHNVGAEKPEDYGYYLAWGETQPKSKYYWSTYQHCMDTINTLTKYCSYASYGYEGFTDNLTALLPEDDAATVNMGPEWHIPTKSEWQELYMNTTQTWTTFNGVRGRRFTGANGNSIFLPAPGYKEGSTLHYVRSDGDYWSSTLCTPQPYRAWWFYFDNDEYGLYDIGGERYYGSSVRAVRTPLEN